MDAIELLKSHDEEVRRKGLTKLMDINEATPEDLKPFTDQLLVILSTTDDDYLSLQLSNMIETVASLDSTFIPTNSTKVIQALDNLNSKNLDDDGSLFTAVAMKLLTLLQPLLTSNPEFQENSIPVLLKLMGRKSSVKWSAYNPIASFLLTKPQVLQGHSRALLEIGRELPIILSMLPNLYVYEKDVFNSSVDKLIELYAANPSNQAEILGVLQKIASENGTLVAPYVSTLKRGLQSPSTGVLTLMIFEDIAKTSPDTMRPMLVQLVENVKYNPNGIYQTANILSLVGRAFPDSAGQIMTDLISMIEHANQQMIPLLLAELRNIVAMDKELISQHLLISRNLENDLNESVRDQAEAIINIVEGKDLRSLSDKIDEQNRKFAEAAESWESLKDYIDENISEIKEYVSEITKKLPFPAAFSTEGKIRKTLILYYNCSIQTDRCLYPTDRGFTTETKVWNRWMKVALSAVKLGKAVMLPTHPGEAMNSVKSAYEAFKEKNDENFLDYIKEPFLTSSETDEMIEQLKSANYFGVFVYDVQEAGWNCIMCNPRAL